jgi:predicted nucleotidyltransferase
VRLDFTLNGYTFTDEFMVIPRLSDPVIIGAKTLQAWRMELDFENHDVIIDPKVTKLKLLPLTQEDVTFLSHSFWYKSCINLEKKDRKIKMNLKYENYKDFLDVILEMLKNKTNDGILSVVLYGSVARGKARPESDIDLLILYDKEKINLNKIFPEIIIKPRETEEYKELFEKGIYAEVSPYIVTVEELRENPLILLDIMDEGIILYEKRDCFRELIKMFKEKLKELGLRKVYLEDGTYYWGLTPDWKPGELVEIKI